MRSTFAVILISCLLAGAYTLSAQSPEKFNYQGVARDATGNVLVSQAVSLRISILQGTLDGTAVYVETHTTTTNTHGQLTVTIGGGTPVSGTFSTIGWGSQPHFMKTEMDATGGASYTLMGTTQLLSVPYALYAKTSGSGISLADSDGDTKIQVEETTDEDIIRFDVAGAEKLMVNHRGLVLPNTTDSLTGVIYKGTERFIHNYKPATNDGYNTFVGVNAGNFTMIGDNIYHASNNVGVGYSVLKSNTSGYNNTANGTGALYSNTTGAENTANGKYTLYSNTTGWSNTAIGSSALFANTTGYNNTAIGTNALRENKASSRSTAIGTRAIQYADDRTSYRETYNTAVGYEALKGSSTPSNNTGQYNSAIGDQALSSNTSGNENAAIGDMALFSNTSGSNNTAIGAKVLVSNKANSRSTAIGYEAMYYADDRTSGRNTYNTAVGFGALKGSNSPSNNTGTSNTSVGDESMRWNTSGSNNAVMGVEALHYNSTGYNNTALGYRSMYINQTGSDNTAIGYGSLRYNLDGSYNSVLGYLAAYKNTTGQRNTCIGYMAGRHNETGHNNTIIGSQAAANDGVGSFSFNSFLGHSAGYEVTSGSNNSLFGAYSGYEITTGSNNLLLGYNAGDHITTGSNNIVIGYDINPPSATANNQMVIGNSSTLYGDLINNYIGIGTTAPHAPLQLGNNATNRKIVLYEDANNDHQYFGFGINTAAMRYQIAGTDSDHIFYAGNGSSSSNELARIKGNGTLRVSSLSTNGPVYSNNNILTNTNPSDRNLKENIVPIGNSMDKVMALNPVTYTWKSNGAKGIGFIAQEVEEVIPQLVNTNEDGTKGIYSLEMIPFLVKAIQELESKMNKQSEMIGQLQETIQLQNSKIDELNKTQ